MKAKNYSEYIVESDKYAQETLAEMGIPEGSATSQYFYKIKNSIDRNNQYLLQNYPPPSPYVAQRQAEATESEVAGIMHRLRQEDLETAGQVEQAIHTFGAKLRGPSIVEKLVSEPYHTKEEGYKLSGFASLAAGLGLGWLLAGQFGANVFQTIGIMAAIGISAGAVLPGAATWIADTFFGPKKSDDNNYEQSKSQSQTLAQGKERGQDQGHEQQRGKPITFREPDLTDGDCPRDRRNEDEDKSPSDRQNNDRKNDVHDLPDHVRRAARRAGRHGHQAINPGRYQVLAGPHSGMGNIPQYPGQTWVQHGNRWDSPTGLAPSYYVTPGYLNGPAVGTNGAALSYGGLAPGGPGYGGLNGLAQPWYTNGLGYGNGAFNFGNIGSPNGYANSYGYANNAYSQPVYPLQYGGYGGFGGGYGGYGGGYGLYNGGYGLNTGVRFGSSRGRMAGIVGQLPNIGGTVIDMNNLPNFPPPGGLPQQQFGHHNHRNHRHHQHDRS